PVFLEGLHFSSRLRLEFQFKYQTGQPTMA
ncbi:hypothetical protein TVAGG3_0673880, partial [Trichomonas vaginalis G3]